MLDEFIQTGHHHILPHPYLITTDVYIFPSPSTYKADTATLNEDLKTPIIRRHILSQKQRKPVFNKLGMQIALPEFPLHAIMF
jgi:hypothetical protein